MRVSRAHGVAGAGTARAPALAGPVAKLSDVQLIELLQNPDPKMRAGGMSPLVATPAQITSLVSYLRALPRGAAAPQREAAPSEFIAQGKTEAAIEGPTDVPPLPHRPPALPRHRRPSPLRWCQHHLAVVYSLLMVALPATDPMAKVLVLPPRSQA